MTSFEINRIGTVSCVISDCWVMSVGETVNKTRLGLIFEWARGLTSGLTFSEQFICNSKATSDPS